VAIAALAPLLFLLREQLGFQVKFNEPVLDISGAPKTVGQEEVNA